MFLIKKKLSLFFIQIKSDQEKKIGAIFIYTVCVFVCLFIKYSEEFTEFITKKEKNIRSNYKYRTEEINWKRNY